MMVGRRWVILLVTVSAVFLLTCARNLLPESTVPRMAKEELKPLLGNPGVAVLDVRLEHDWARAKEKIAGAVREDPEKDVKAWAGKYSKDKSLVFY